MNLLIPLCSSANGAWGGLTRAVAVTLAAAAAGHQTAFCASGYLALNLRGRGSRVSAMPAPTLLSLPRSLAWLVNTLLAQRLRGTLRSIWQVPWISGVLGRRYLSRLWAARPWRNVPFYPCVSVLALRPHCDWTVSPGGQNAIVQSLPAGVGRAIAAQGEW